MKQIRLLVLAAGLLTLGAGAALAQTVSNGDAYQQGYAAGAAAQDTNSFKTYDDAYQAGKLAAERSQENLDARDQGYNNGYQAGKAETSQNSRQAYNNGYQDRAFDHGYTMGADRQAQADADADFP